MDFIDTINIAGSGLTAERVRLQAVSSNMANARTTRTEDGGPYRRQVPIYRADAVRDFGSELDDQLKRVSVPRVDQLSGYREVHDPAHPDADANGTPDVLLGLPGEDAVAWLPALEGGSTDAPLRITGSGTLGLGGRAATGDLDGDGHVDLLLAAPGLEAILLLPGPVLSP